MKTIKLISKLTTGCSIKINYLDGSKSDKAKVLGKSITGKYETTRAYFMNKNLVIYGVNSIIAMCEVLPFKRYKFRYKR